MYKKSHCCLSSLNSYTFNTFMFKTSVICLIQILFMQDSTTLIMLVTRDPSLFVEARKT